MPCGETVEAEGSVLVRYVNKQNQFGPLKRPAQVDVQGQLLMAKLGNLLEELGTGSEGVIIGEGSAHLQRFPPS